MDERRKSYNQVQAEARKTERERIRAFKEAHPERFAELVAKVQSDEPVSERRMSIHETIEENRARINTARIDEIVRNTHRGRRDYILRAKDEYGDERTLFFGFPISYVPKPGDVLKTPIKGTVYTITEVTPCTCPLCT